ncbi:aminotransferase class IV family protein [Pseudoalteromonas luteoviolacea]|uniref:aminotransferase class IV family protein n=1 Tax=Pseudoalteromonas luteoviolacea TaxID=43657 RepID=UPI00114EFD53|nr:aminotransferase class IV family protein [Pseudoalteromonas luteoviolacea]TQF70330.1 aminotransferase class IV [Pseudoalteromonas luteoviolacea]
MNTQSFFPQTFINGLPIVNSNISSLAFSGFAHFTALQVRNKMVKGLDLHLGRLSKASLELYNHAHTNDMICSFIRAAIDNGPADQSLTVTIYSPHGEFTSDSMNAEPHVMVRTAKPENGPLGPLRLSAIQHERPFADIKHVGEIGKTYYLHQAIKQGFDDAIFIDNNGHLSEGTIWNLAFWDGDSVIWPKAHMLKGTMMAILQRQLNKLNISQRSEAITLDRLKEFQGAALMNSWTPGIEVSEIMSTPFQQSQQLVSILHHALKQEPAERV